MLAGGAPNLAAASIQAAFNIANSLGAYLGGLAIAAGYGYSSPNAVAPSSSRQDSRWRSP